MKETKETGPRRYVVATGSLGVSEEVVSAAGEVFGDYMVGSPRLITDSMKKNEADIFLCFVSRIPELAQKVPLAKILGINMVPTHHFCLTLNAIPADQTRWVFCNSHKSAQVIIDYCEQFGLPVDNFSFATYEDTPAEELLSILRQARCIVGVSPMVALLQARFGEHLREDCRVVTVRRVLSSDSIAVIYRWILNINCQLELSIQNKNRSLEKTLRKMAKIQKQLEYESTHDSLTGCYNRRYFEETLERADGSGKGFTALSIMDMDGLKQINDTFGHDEGDAVLRKVGNVLRSCFRKKDIIARIGGDEFAAILADASEQDVQRMLSCVKEKFREWEDVEKRYPVNLSLGCSSTEAVHKSALQLFKEADAAMYLEKAKQKSTGLCTSGG